ncbi:MAG: glutamate synthase subunit beta [Candidatus Omnitrophota bacterium]
MFRRSMMAKYANFLNIHRMPAKYRPVCERTKDYKQVFISRPEKDSEDQALRCMDCGTPFCHWACPTGNYIPEWNALAAKGQWKEAFDILAVTNPFPEITGRICPALCEFSCVLGLNDDPITIRENELAIIEHAFKKGYIKPVKPEFRSNCKVAVIGSGPAGLSCAFYLNRLGYDVTVFERDNRLGGLLRYGIPDFKLQKDIIDRRIAFLEKEGIGFKVSVDIGSDLSIEEIKQAYKAVVLACGARVPRDLNINGRELKGIYFAMDYLTQANRFVSGEKLPDDNLIDVKDKKVVVIGGGDTGSDCIGTAIRQGASCVVQIEIMPKPSECRTEDCPWPKYPMLLKTTSSHEEGCQRYWSVLTKKFVGENGTVKKLLCVNVEFEKGSHTGSFLMKEVPDSEFEIEADVIIIAAGFISAETEGLFSSLGIDLDSKGRVQTDNSYMTGVEGVFSAGDMRRGQSLVVWAIADGRDCANAVDEYRKK